MHGRLKEKTTAEQAEAKRIERQKKLKIFTAANKRISEKRENKEYDKEGLEISGQILSANPDVYTLWNFRKEIFEAMKSQKSEDALNKLFEEELHFVETCLRANPKSYGSWNQRCYVMTTMPRPDWKNELALCNKFLEYDDRNFHCWDYRRFVINKSAVSATQELEFSTSKISSNFSNYSSWHYRSKLLPLVHPDPTQHIGITEEALLNEFEIVQNAFFTDPDDQSAWFYHRWLLGRGDRDLAIHSLLLNRSLNTVTVGTTLPVLLGKDCSGTVKVNGEVVRGDWRTVTETHRRSPVWIFHAAGILLAEDCDIEITMNTSNDTSPPVVCRYEFKSGETRAANLTPSPSLFSGEISAAASLFLTKELDQCEELHEIEPDNKWALLTIVLLMKSVDSIKYWQKISNSLVKLQELDKKRKNYYRDLRSKFLLELTLDKLERCESLMVSGQDLTTVYHIDLLLTAQDINLSHNSLSALTNFSLLQGVEKLDLGDNQITSVAGLSYLPSLQSLHLQNNNISSIEDLRILTTCPNLKTIVMTGNPVTTTTTKEQFIQNLKPILPSVDIII